MSRQDALERYRSFPVPDTTQEPWRFTDLAGFDPETFKAGTVRAGTVPRGDSTMLDIAVAGVARVSEAGIEIERAPEGVVLDAPLYVKITNTAEGGSLFWRLLVIAEEGSRFSLIEEYESASPV